jgi:outer membrane protein OmpA-like peptidoglycan-associated protein
MAGIKLGIVFNRSKDKGRAALAPVVNVVPASVETPDTVEKAAETQPAVAVQIQEPQTPTKPVNPRDSIYKQAQSLAAAIEIKFPLNHARAVREDNEKLMQLSNLLKYNSDIQLLIVGHTCNLGSYKVNKKIGLKRALFVKRQLVQSGVSPNQIHCISKAYDEPLVPGTSPENRAQNRRVELKVK